MTRSNGHRGQFFGLRRPASELFADFEETSRRVTRHHHEKVLGLEFAAQDLVSSEESIREVTANWQAQAALRRIYGEVHPILAPLLHGQAFPGVLDHPCPMAEWQRARNQTNLLRPDAEKASAECIHQLQVLVDLTAARHLAAANLAINPTPFGLPDDARTVEAQKTAAQNLIKEGWSAVQEHVRSLEPFVASVRTRLSLALLMGGEAPHEVQAWVPVLTAVGQVMPVVHQMAGRLRALPLLTQHRSNHSDPSEVNAELSRLAQELRDCVAQMQSVLGAVPYPFPNPRGIRSVADFLRSEQAGDTALEAVHRNSDAHVARMFELHGRLLGRLVVLADTAERGMAAPEDPSPQDPSAAPQHPQ